MIDYSIDCVETKCNNKVSLSNLFGLVLAACRSRFNWHFLVQACLSTQVAACFDSASTFFATRFTWPLDEQSLWAKEALGYIPH